MAHEAGSGGGVEQRWALVVPHREHMLAVARRRCPSEEDAEDVVQEAMLRVAEYDKLDPARVGALLTSVTTRLAIDLYRARVRAQRYQSRLVHVPEQEAPPDEAALDAGEALWLAAQLQKLPEREREVFRERVAGYTVGEAASRLGLSYKSVESAFTRARGRMRTWATAGALLAMEYLRRLRQRPGAVLASMAMMSAGCLILSSLPEQPPAGARHLVGQAPPALALWSGATWPVMPAAIPRDAASRGAAASGRLALADGQKAAVTASGAQAHVVFEKHVTAPGGNEAGVGVSQQPSNGGFTADTVACVTGTWAAAQRLDTRGLAC